MATHLDATQLATTHFAATQAVASQAIAAAFNPAAGEVGASSAIGTTIAVMPQMASPPVEGPH